MFSRLAQLPSYSKYQPFEQVLCNYISATYPIKVLVHVISLLDNSCNKLNVSGGIKILDHRLFFLNLAYYHL